MSELFDSYSPYYVFLLECMICIFVFCNHLKPKKHFIGRLIFVLIAILLISWVIPYTVIQYPVLANFGFRWVTTSIMLFLSAYFIFDVSFYDLFFRLILALLVQNFSSGILDVFNLLVLKDASYHPLSWAKLIIDLIVFVLTYYYSKQKIKETFYPTYEKIIILFVTILGYICDTIIFNKNTSTEDLLFRGEVTFLISFIDVLCFFLLITRNDLNQKEHDKKILEQLIEDNKQQYYFQKDTIDLINVKAHNLKYQILALKNNQDSSSFEEIEKSIEHFDKYFHTGNTALDVVLTNRSYQCENNNININFIGDGSLLNNILSPEDVATIFGNLIDNAIEYLKIEDNIENKEIIIRINKSTNGISIYLSNPLKTNLKFENGVPLTTKGNNGFHGYGMKSVKMIVSNNHGNCVFNAGNGRFDTNILFFYTFN